MIGKPLVSCAKSGVGLLHPLLYSRVVGFDAQMHFSVFHYLADSPCLFDTEDIMLERPDNFHLATICACSP